jgi:hypothetical protein
MKKQTNDIKDRLLKKSNILSEAGALRRGLVPYWKELSWGQSFLYYIFLRWMSEPNQ